MRIKILGVLATLVAIAAATTFSQSGKSPTLPTIVTAEEIETVVKTPPGGDREVKIVDLGRMNLGVAVLRRGATKSGAPVGAINHTHVIEAYYVVSGEGTMVTGGEVTNVRPLAPDNELVTTVVGPGFQGTFVKPEFSQKVKTGDVVIIPAGVYHGFSEVPDHIEYVTIRPDPDKVLPGGYIHPSIRPQP